MWDKKLIISKHVKKRFEQRHIKLSKNYISIEQQIRYDLRPLNVRKKERINDVEIKVTTNQGKIYILKEIGNTNKIIVKTVYKIDMRKETLNLDENFYGT